MPRNNQGVYTLPAGNPVVPGTLIETTWANPTMSDIAAALTGSLPRDGSAGMSGPLILSTSSPSNPLEAASKAYVQSFMVYATGMPVGAAMPFLGNNPPPGFLICNGQAVSRTAYAELFAVIGTIYGAGDGVSTFNVPDLRNQFIRGKADDRAVGSTQAGSFAAHTHPVSDPGHTHVASGSQAAHAHTITTGSHNHSVNDPGHSHSKGFDIAGVGVNAATAGTPWQTSTGSTTTGISLNAVGNLGGSADSQQPAVTVSLASATTGETIGSTGGTETVPQNMALIYVVKAVNDTTQVGAVTSLASSDVNMIAIDETNPAIPVLDIKSNVAFGTVKLDSAGQIPVNLMPTTGVTYQGQLDASSGNLPVGSFVTGDFYNIAVGGTLSLRTSAGGPVPTVVVVGDQVIYDETISGWWYNAASAVSSMAAAAVTVVPSGTVSATNAQAAIEELDSEKVSKSGDTMTGQLKGIYPVDNEDLTRKEYVDDRVATRLTQAAADALYVSLTGDAMSGPLGLSTIRNSFNVVDAIAIASDGKVSFPQMAQSLISSGYISLPGGLVIQWGANTFSVAGATITFPIAFPNACLRVVGTANGASPVTVGTEVVSNTTFMGYSVGGSFGAQWIAVGF